MAPVIRFEHVSKKYNLHRDRPRSFREVFVGRFRRAPTLQHPDAKTFWALRDVSFEIHPGETIGFIGVNGAGKSTALKLMSRIIQPTEGRVHINGRVTALLELGMGFHPELTGRDNVYMSGALMGMGRAEMQRKFDSIVDFSEIEDFIDTPVKHYSSGMFARLAFAVSIHLDPEALLVDEVLAVGDQAFQQKCMDRIAELQRSGITICMVSHSPDTIRQMCTRAIWFDHGHLLADGSAEAVARQYLDKAAMEEARRLVDATAAAVAAANALPPDPPPAPPVESASPELTSAVEETPSPAPVVEVAPPPPQKRWGTRQIEITRVRLLDAAGEEQVIFKTGEAMAIQLEYRAKSPTPPPVFGIGIHRHDGLHITGPNTEYGGLHLPEISGAGALRYDLAYLPLLEGLYHLSVAVVNQTDTEMYDYHDQLYPFRVQNGASAVRERYGVVTLRGQWEHQRG